MDVTVAIKKLIDADKGLQKEARRFVEVRVAAELLGQVKKRVQDYGINAEGVQFRGYSTRPCLFGYSKQIRSPLNPAFAKLKAQAKKITKKEGSVYGGWVTVNGHKLIVVPGGYKAIRNAAGYQIMHKDYTLSGNMWRLIKVKPVIMTGSKFIIQWGTTDELTTNKVLGHNSREGTNIIASSDKEIKDMEQNVVGFIEDYVLKILNG